MRPREKISVSLMRASDDQPFPLYGPEKDHSSTRETIQVMPGDIFYPRIKVASDFKWHKSNILAIRVNYSHGHFGGCCEFPWLKKPKTPVPLIVDLRRSFVWSDRWNTVSTQFFCGEVSSSQLTALC